MNTCISLSCVIWLSSSCNVYIQCILFLSFPYLQLSPMFLNSQIQAHVSLLNCRYKHIAAYWKFLLVTQYLKPHISKIKRFNHSHPLIQYAHPHAHTYTDTCTHAHTYTDTRPHAHTYTDTRTHAHTYTDARPHVHLFLELHFLGRY